MIPAGSAVPDGSLPPRRAGIEAAIGELDIPRNLRSLSRQSTRFRRLFMICITLHSELPESCQQTDEENSPDPATVGLRRRRK